MRLLGLIGYPISHSWSATYFSEIFSRENISDMEYQLFPLARIDMLPELLQVQSKLIGINVTIPHKTTIVPFLHERDETARAIGAVNTVKISRDGKHLHLKGYNTDAKGFLLTLTDQVLPKKALILGTGGAAKAVAWALKQRNVESKFVSRKGTSNELISYNSITRSLLDDYTLIVNATPIGMYPAVDSAPTFPYALLSGKHFLYDLIYNPLETMFLKNGKAAGAKTQNGYSMLVQQAELAFKIFTTA